MLSSIMHREFFTIRLLRLVTGSAMLGGGRGRGGGVLWWIVLAAAIAVVAPVMLRATGAECDREID